MCVIKDTEEKWSECHGATRRHSQLSSYRTYGSVAYAPAYDGTAVRAPRREEVLRPKPRVRPRERVLTRTQVQVREAGQASVFAVIGFLAVGVFAALAAAELHPVRRAD